MLRGVDIAGSYQAGFSVAAAAGDGVAFCVVKISEGTSTGATWDSVNWSWAQRWIAEARQVGVVPGGYHFLRAGDGAAQARLFHDRIRQVGGPDGMLIQLDCESDGYAPQMQSWVAEWNALTGGHPVVIYSGAWWWPRTGGFNGASLTPYLWHSHYLWDSGVNDSRSGTFAQLEGQVPGSWWQPGYGGWSRATILQFTSRGTTGGITSNVDLNLFDGTADDLVNLAGGDMLTDAEHKMLADTAWAATHVMYRGMGPLGMQAAIESVGNDMAALQAKLDGLSMGGIDVDELAAKVAARLSLPTAAEVAEELARRLGNG